MCKGVCVRDGERERVCIYNDVFFALRVCVYLQKAWMVLVATFWKITFYRKKYNSNIKSMKRKMKYGQKTGRGERKKLQSLAKSENYGIENCKELFKIGFLMSVEKKCCILFRCFCSSSHHVDAFFYTHKHIHSMTYKCLMASSSEMILND